MSTHQDEERVAELLRSAPTVPMPSEVAERLRTVLRTEQQNRAAGECHRAHTEAMIAASKRTALGTFGPNPINRVDGLTTRLRRARAIGA